MVGLALRNKMENFRASRGIVSLLRQLGAALNSCEAQVFCLGLGARLRSLVGAKHHYRCFRGELFLGDIKLEEMYPVWIVRAVFTSYTTFTSLGCKPAARPGYEQRDIPHGHRSMERFVFSFQLFFSLSVFSSCSPQTTFLY